MLRVNVGEKCNLEKTERLEIEVFIMVYILRTCLNSLQNVVLNFFITFFKYNF